MNQEFEHLIFVTVTRRWLFLLEDKIVLYTLIQGWNIMGVENLLHLNMILTQKYPYAKIIFFLWWRFFFLHWSMETLKYLIVLDQHEAYKYQWSNSILTICFPYYLSFISATLTHNVQLTWFWDERSKINEWYIKHI